MAGMAEDGKVAIATIVRNAPWDDVMRVNLRAGLLRQSLHRPRAFGNISFPLRLQ
jgi:hypothetical protein